MPRLGKKVKSKRVTLKQKHKIEKKVVEHEKKMRRLARKHPWTVKPRSKDAGLPNLHPFKEHLLRRLQKTKMDLEDAERRRMRRNQMLALRRKGELGGDGDEDGEYGAGAASSAAGAGLGGESGFEGLAKRAERRAEEFGEDGGVEEEDGEEGGGKSIGEVGVRRLGALNRRQYYRHLRTVVEKADVILEVLDARDPLGSRADEIEQWVLESGPEKRLVLVLNKCDLVPAPVVQQWLRYLRRSFPTVAFKASTQKQKDRLAFNAGARVGKAIRRGEVITGAGAAGADTLLQLIKNYTRNASGPRRAVVVGVIGYPNCGKSSLINSLKRARAVSVSPTPGHTKQIQEVALDSQVRLLDSPGVIFDASSSVGASSETPTHHDELGTGLLLRNCVAVDQIPDPEAVVAAIVARCAPDKLCEIYGVSIFDSASDFLQLVARKRGKLRKKDTPDTDAAARIVLRDWNSGAIPFFTLPPTTEATLPDDEDRVAIVDQWNKDFGMSDLVHGEEEDGEDEDGEDEDGDGGDGAASAAAMSSHIALATSSAPAASAAASSSASTSAPSSSSSASLGLDVGRVRKLRERAEAKKSEYEGPTLTEDDLDLNPTGSEDKAIRKALKKERRRGRRALLEALERGEEPDEATVALATASQTEMAKAAGVMPRSAAARKRTTDQHIHLGLPAAGIDAEELPKARKKKAAEEDEDYNFDEFF